MKVCFHRADLTGLVASGELGKCGSSSERRTCELELYLHIGRWQQELKGSFYSKGTYGLWYHSSPSFIYPSSPFPQTLDASGKVPSSLALFCFLSPTQNSDIGLTPAECGRALQEGTKGWLGLRNDPRPLANLQRPLPPSQLKSPPLQAWHSRQTHSCFGWLFSLAQWLGCHRIALYFHHQTFLQQSFEPGDQSTIYSFASMGKSAFKFQTTKLQINDWTQLRLSNELPVMFYTLQC